jgi:uncharacterized protein YbcI
MSELDGGLSDVLLGALRREAGSTMDGHELHPEDAAAMREPLDDGHGTLRRDISTAVVGLYKQHFGKGPTRCRTYLEPNLVVVILGEGYTAGEQTLFEAGRWYEVRNAREIWQDSMQERFVTTIEELTGRRVGAFMSANHQDPDLAVELFLLDPPSD